MPREKKNSKVKSPAGNNQTGSQPKAKKRKSNVSAQQSNNQNSNLILIPFLPLNDLFFFIHPTPLFIR